jgi:hypothetical protein
LLFVAYTSFLSHGQTFLVEQDCNEYAQFAIKTWEKMDNKNATSYCDFIIFIGLLSVSESNEQQIGKDSYRGVRQKQGILFSSIGNL